MGTRRKKNISHYKKYLKTKRSKCPVVSTRTCNSTTEKMRCVCQEVSSHERTIGMSTNSYFLWIGYLDVTSEPAEKQLQSQYFNGPTDLYSPYNKNKAHPTPDNFLHSSLSTCNQLFYITGMWIFGLKSDKLYSFIS